MNPMSSCIRLFEKSSHAALYSLYRPTYSKSILDILLDYLSRKGGKHDLAVDIACGSGQSTFYLRHDFKMCIGLDISPEQVKQAQKLLGQNSRNVEFKVADGTNMPVEDSSVDLVTIATAWHWIMDKEKLYSECKRVLKPEGCLAVYTYDIVQTKNSEVNGLIHSFYVRLKSHWHPAFNPVVKPVIDHYKDVTLPFSNIERVQTTMTITTTLPGLIGFISSLSSYRKYYNEDPSMAGKELQQLSDSIEGKLDSSNENQKMHFQYDNLDAVYPVYLVMGQNDKLSI